MLKVANFTYLTNTKGDGHAKELFVESDEESSETAQPNYD